MTGRTVLEPIMDGWFTVTEFSASGGNVYATGTLTGTCRVVEALGRTVTQVINTAVSGRGTRQSLHLEVWPVDLDLSGLVVHTDKIVIEVIAQSGPGNLPGNLLCAITNALNSSAPVSHRARLLNQLLAVLG
jgi:hypothetical protein